MAIFKLMGHVPKSIIKWRYGQKMLGSIYFESHIYNYWAKVISFCLCLPNMMGIWWNKTLILSAYLAISANV